MARFMRSMLFALPVHNEKPAIARGLADYLYP
jgi:hypothetical protein